MEKSSASTPCPSLSLSLLSTSKHVMHTGLDRDECDETVTSKGWVGGLALPSESRETCQQRYTKLRNRGLHLMAMPTTSRGGGSFVCACFQTSCCYVHRVRNKMEAPMLNTFSGNQPLCLHTHPCHCGGRCLASLFIIAASLPDQELTTAVLTSDSVRCDTPFSQRASSH